MRLSPLALFLPLALAVASRSLAAQGSLSTQAFGYPAGGHSVRDAGTGGALGEFDPMSPNNPAALASWGAPGFYFQFSPEYRTVQSGGGTDKTTTVRFPLLAAAMPLGERWVVGVSATTFLDRTWQTQVNGVENFGGSGDTASYTQTFGVNGAIDDYRLGASFRIAPWLRVGVAAHVLAGSNRDSILRKFNDTLSFATFHQGQRISYSGAAFGAGIDIRPTQWAALAGSFRAGGTIKAFGGDTTLSRATIPTHYAGSFLFTGLPGTNIGVRAAYDGWSTLRTLGTADISARDAWDVSVGGETRGVTLGNSPLPLRLGVEWRTLPFAVGTNAIKETLYGGGFAVPLGGGRMNADVSIQRATRTGVAGISEHAWLLGFGFTVRP